MHTGILRKLLLALATGAAISACGGGGGGGSQTAEPPANDSAGLQPNPAQPGTQTPDDDAAAPVNPDQDGNDFSDGSGSETRPGLTLVWDAPNTRTDGSCLDEVALYKINYGTASGVYQESLEVAAGKLDCVPTGESNGCGAIVGCSYMLDGLDAASWHFTVQAVDAAGNISAFSNEKIVTLQ